MLDDIKRALLGDKEAAKRLTDAGVLLPCPFCGGNKGGIDGTILLWESSGLYAHKRTGKCVLDGAIIYNLADWNTRTQNLSAEEMEMLEGME